MSPVSAETVAETAARLDVEQPGWWGQEDVASLVECRDEENCHYCGQWVVEIQQRSGGAR
jgi:hypothetical protein